MGTTRSAVRWAGRHGIAGMAIRAGGRRGDLHARITDPAARADPHALYDQIRAQAAIVPGKFAFATARHAVVSEVLRHDDFRAGFPDGALPRTLAAALRWARDPAVLGPIEPPSLLVVDGVEHARYRRLVSKAFTARAVDALAVDVERIAADLLDRLEAGFGANRSADLVTDYAATLPVQVIASILGVPGHMANTFLSWGGDLAPSLDIGLDFRAFRRYERALRALNAWLLEHFAALRRDPGEDLLSRVIAAGREESGPELSDPELTSVAGLVLAAGFETTVNLIGNGAVLLLDRPDQLAALRADPAGWRNAVEEVLRFDSPVQNTARHASRDTVVAGVPIAAGRLVALLIGGANRDPEVFADPHAFDVARPNAREHLSFSAGSHYCLGSALARLEGEIGLRQLFERFDSLEPAGVPERRPTRTLRGWARVPVRLGTAVPAS